MKNEIIQKLRDIGLNQLEAEVYSLLLSEEPMTAYKVGRLLKKPTANIYKAVEVLFNKGAVIIEEGKNKLCKAVAPKEFIATQQHEFATKIKQAANALTNIKPQVAEEKTYSLDSVNLAIEKAKRMINKAKEIIVVDAFPLSLDAMLPELKSAIKKGVTVLVQCYSEITIKGADVFITQDYNDVISYWQSQQLNLVVDGSESLIALFDKTMTMVYHATWSTNLYLSCITHAGRVCEQTIHKLMAVPDSANKLQEIENILNTQKFMRHTNVPGLRTLFEQHMSNIKTP